MFKIKNDQVIRNWPCKVPVAKDGGEIEHHKIALDFELLSGDELEGLVDAEALKRVIKGWDGIADEVGEPLPFNEENLAAVCRMPNFRKAAFKGYWDCVAGNSPEKN